jgi:hypothetical protein
MWHFSHSHDDWKTERGLEPIHEYQITGNQHNIKKPPLMKVVFLFVAGTGLEPVTFGL